MPILSDDDLLNGPARGNVGNLGRAAAGQAKQSDPSMLSDDDLLGAPLPDSAKTTPMRSAGDWAQDVGNWAMKGGNAAAEQLVGLADIPLKGKLGKFLDEDLSINFKGANEYWDKALPQSKASDAADKAWNDASGVGEDLAALYHHPSLILSGAVQSAPGMLVGGLEGKGAVMLAEGLAKQAPKLAKFAKWVDNWSGQVGEGLASAGSTAEQIREDSPDGELTGAQSAIAGGSGALTALLSVLGGKAARWLGIHDVDDMVAGQKKKIIKQIVDGVEQAPTEQKAGFAKRILGGMISEGLLEEAPQSAQEQMAQNLAEGKPLMEGVEKATIQGAAVGGAMGIASNVKGDKETAPVGEGEKAPNPAEPKGPSASQEYAQFAFGPDLQGVGETVETQKQTRALMATALHDMDAEDRAKAIDHLAAGDEELKNTLHAAAEDEALIAQGRGQKASNVMPYIAMNTAIRQHSGVWEQDGINPTSATAVAGGMQDQTQQAGQQAQAQAQAGTGFEEEPDEQVAAQLQALREGRIKAVIMSPAQSNRMDFRGLPQPGLARGNDGHEAVIAAADDATIQTAVGRAQEVGLKQAMGEAKGYVDPTLTQQPDTPTAVFQRRDLNTGHILHEEVVQPHQVSQVQDVPGTVTHIKSAQQALEERLASAPQMQQTEAPAPAEAQAPLHEKIRQMFNGAKPQAEGQGTVTPRIKTLVRDINAGLGISDDNSPDAINPNSVLEVDPGKYRNLNQLAKAIERFSGTQVVFVNTPHGELKTISGKSSTSFNGVALRRGNRLYLNVASATPLNTLGHEMAHILERLHPDLYEKLEIAVISRLRHSRALKLHADLSRAVKSEGPSSLSAQLFRQEVVAEGIGEMAEEQQFWKELFAQAGTSQEAKSFFQTLIEFIGNLAKKLTQVGYIAGVKDMQSVRKAMTEAYLEWSRRYEHSLQPAATAAQAPAAAPVAQAPAAAPVAAPPAAPIADAQEANRAELGEQTDKQARREATGNELKLETREAVKAEAEKKAAGEKKVADAQQGFYDAALASPYAARVKALADRYTAMGDEESARSTIVGVGYALANAKEPGKLPEGFFEHKEEMARKMEAVTGKASPIKAEPVTLQSLLGEGHAGNALPTQITTRAVERANEIVQEMAKLGVKPDDLIGTNPYKWTPEIRALERQYRDVYGALLHLLSSRYSVAGRKNKNTAKHNELEDFASKALGMDTREFGGIDTSREIGDGGSYTNRSDKKAAKQEKAKAEKKAKTLMPQQMVEAMLERNRTNPVEPPAKIAAPQFVTPVSTKENHAKNEAAQAEAREHNRGAIDVNDLEDGNWVGNDFGAMLGDPMLANGKLGVLTSVIEKGKGKNASTSFRIRLEDGTKKWFQQAVVDKGYQYVTPEGGKAMSARETVAALKAAEDAAREQAKNGTQDNEEDDEDTIDVESRLLPSNVGGKAMHELTREQQEDPWEDGDWGDSLFESPAKTVNADKIKSPVLGLEEAAQVRSSWVKTARSLGKTRGNYDKVVLSLFDQTGNWAQPWVEAGYKVITMDLRNGQDITKLDLMEHLEEAELLDGNVEAVLAAVPCTNFASTANRWKAEKEANGQMQVSVDLVNHTKAIIEILKPRVWAIENPIGEIQTKGGLPNPRMRFQPHNYGDPYTKRTNIFGKFNPDLPQANVFPTEASKVQSALRGDSPADKAERSETPLGFAYAFFMANAGEITGTPVGNVKIDPKVSGDMVTQGYGEDTATVGIGDDEDSLRERLTGQIAVINEWLDANRLKSGNPPGGKKRKDWDFQMAERARLESLMPPPATAEQNRKKYEARVGKAMAAVTRFVSGASPTRDIQIAGHTRGGMEKHGIGAEAGRVSLSAMGEGESGVEAMARVILDYDTQVFVDSGAFNAFTYNLRLEGLNARRAEQGKSPLKPKTVDFTKVFDKYDAILDELDKLNATDDEGFDFGDEDAWAELDDDERDNYMDPGRNSGKDTIPPLFVAPDVVGNQTKSLELLEKFADRIKPMIESGRAKMMVPLQEGALTLSEAYDKAAEILGTDDFVVGIPSNEAAVSHLDLVDFLRDSQPAAVHFLGAASDTKLQPRIEAVVQAGADKNTELSADAATPMRTDVPNRKAKLGQDHQTAVERATLTVDDPAMVRSLTNDGENPMLFSRTLRSTVDLMLADDQTARSSLGLNPNPKRGAGNNVREIANSLNRRTLLKEGVIRAKDQSDATADVLAHQMADEVAYQLGTTSATGTGLGWYSHNYPNAVKFLGKRFPELLKSKDARAAFTALVAVTSNGEKVTLNIANAVKLYQKFRLGQPLADANVGVRRATALENNLQQFEDLVSEYGISGMRKLLLEEITVADMNRELRARGEKSDGSYQAVTVIPRAAIYFGPKLGAFYANLSGSEGYLTMDLWWSRTLNRMRGLLMPSATPSSIARFKELIGEPNMTREQVLEAVKAPRDEYEKYNFTTQLEFLAGGKEPSKNDPKLADWLKNAKRRAGPAYEAMLREHQIEKAANTIYKNEFEVLKEAPFGATDRTFMYTAARKAQALLAAKGINLSLADIQAALWYYEKRLYQKLSGRKADDIGYEEAIRASAESDRPEPPSVRFSRTFDDRHDAQAAVAVPDRAVQKDPARKAGVNFSRLSQTAIRDRQGNPLEVYHGGEADLDRYDFGRLGKNAPNPSAHLGAWMTSDRREAARYGDVKSAYLDIRHPKTVAVDKLPAFDTPQQAENYRRMLQAQGYDGLIVDATKLGGTTNYVAFKPEQIVTQDIPDAEATELTPEELAAMGVQFQRASLSPERIQNIVDDLGYNDGRSKGYVASVNPQDFIKATTTSDLDRTSITKEAGELDLDKLRGQRQTPFLFVDRAPDGSMTVVGHEGRHRMDALARAGVTSVPVVVVMHENGYRKADHYTPLDSMSVKGEEFGHGKGGGITVRNLVPASYKFQSLMTQEHGQGGVNFSRKGSTNADPGFSGAKTLREAMNRVVETGTDFEKLLARRLRFLVGDAPFRVVENGVEVPGGVPLALHGAHGVQYTNKSRGMDGVWVRGASFGETQGINNETVLHEALHQATARRISIGNIKSAAGTDLGNAVSDLYDLANHVIREFKAAQANGTVSAELEKLAPMALNNPKELISYGLTDPLLQQFLKETKGLHNKSAWSEFVDALRRLVGLDGKHASALADLMDITDRISTAEVPQVSKDYESRLVASGQAQAIQGVNFSRNASKLVSIEEMLHFTQTGELPHHLDDHIARQNWAGAMQAAKDPNERKALMRKLGDWLIERTADSLVPVTRWIENLPLSNNLKQRLSGDMYRAAGLRAHMEKEVKDRYVTRMYDAIEKVAKTHKLSTDQVKKFAGTWMTARYVPKANLHLINKDRAALLSAQRTGDPALIAEAQKNLNDRLFDVGRPALQPGQSYVFKRGVAGGMTDATAAQAKANVEAHIGVNELMSIAQPVYDMLAWKTKKDLASGKVTQAMVNSWPGHLDYVPLTGDPRFDRDTADIFQGGNQINQDIDHAMNGRMDSMADDGIDASFAATLKSVNFAAVKDFKDTLAKAHATAKANGIDIGVTAEPVTGIHRLGDDVIIRRRVVTLPNGMERIESTAFKFANKEVIGALKRENQEQLNAVLSFISVPTRWYARWVTQLMPMFAPINFVRDMWERSEFLRTRTLYGANGQKIDVNKAARASIADAINPDLWRATLSKSFGKPLNVQARGDLEELIRLGGSSTTGDFLKRSANALEADIRKNTGTLARGVRAANHIIEGYNNAFELIPALSIFRALKAQGMDAVDAAANTLDMMNFRKKGTTMPALRALYAFAQPNAQSGYNLARALSTRTGQVRLVAYSVVGSLLYAALKGMWPDDDELGNELDNLPATTVERSIPIKLGDTMVKVPVGFGMPQLAWAGASSLNRMLSGKYTTGDAVFQTALAWTKSFVPVAPSDLPLFERPVDFMIQTLTPTLARPLMGIGTNQTAFGQPLAPERVNPNKMKYEQGKRTTPEAYSEVAKTLYDETGIDMFPDHIKALSDGYLIGPWREVMQYYIENPAREERGEPKRMIGLASLVDNINDRNVLNSVYYQHRKEIERVSREYESRKADGTLDEWTTPEREAQHDAFKAFEKAEGKIGQKRSQSRKTAKADDPDWVKERTTQIESESDEAHRELLRQYLGSIR